MAKELNFLIERETRRTYRFKEISPVGEETVGTLYVQKSFFKPDEFPEEIKVVLEVIKSKIKTKLPFSNGK